MEDFDANFTDDFKDQLKRVRFDYFYKFPNVDIISGYPWRILIHRA